MFNKIIASIVIAVQTMVGGIFNMVPQSYVSDLSTQVQELQLRVDDFENISVGSYYAVGGKYYKLWGSGITSTATSLILTSFTSPVNDQELSIGNFGSEVGYGTIEPENTSNIEFISFSGITQDGSSDKATLTGVVRGLGFVYPYTASSTLAKSHSGGSRFIISNPPMHYGEYAAKRNAETIEGDWTFSATSTPQYASAPTFTSASNEFASVKLVEDTTNQGAATSTEIQSGIVELVSSAELGQGNATGTTGGYLVLTNRLASSTGEFATSSIVVAESDGNINQNFLDLTEDFTFTGDVYSNGSTTIGDTSGDSFRVNASSTFDATTTFNGQIVVNASSTFNATSSFYNGTSTFDRPPIVLDNTNATATDPYSLATRNFVTSKGIQFPNTLASTTMSCSWCTLDLSSIVGTNSAMVYLKLVRGGTGTQWAAKTYGDGTVLNTGGGMTAPPLENGQTAYVIVITDSSGRISIYDNDTQTAGTAVTVISYIK